MRMVLLAAALIALAAPAFADGPCSWGSTHTVSSSSQSQTDTDATASTTPSQPHG